MNLRSHATRLGVLDIGSNTVHMLIVDAAPGARPEPEASVKSTVRLMQYLKEDGTIRKAGVEAVLEAVQKAMKLAEEYEITQLLVLATSALREAPNGGKILRRIEETIGQPVTVLSGVDEARLTFLAARRWYGWDAGRLLVLDIGGGSLEVAMGSDEDPTVALSVPAGAGRGGVPHASCRPPGSRAAGRQHLPGHRGVHHDSAPGSGSRCVATRSGPAR